MPRSPYVVDYTASFELPAPPAVVWAAIEDTGQFERWWGWLANFTIEGDGLQTGSVLHGTVTPPLPYRLRVRVVLDRCVRPEELDAHVDGDLRGDARLRFEAVGEATVARVAWNLEMMHGAMRLAARFAHPLLRWGHDRVVEATVAGFRAQLRRTAP